MCFDQKHHKLCTLCFFLQNKRFSDLQATFKRPVLSDGEQHGLKTSHEFKLSKKGLEGWSESEFSLKSEFISTGPGIQMNAFMSKLSLKDREMWKTP